MKKLFFITILFFCLFAVFSISSADTITIAADEWCPYNCTPKSSMPGYGIEIATIVFKEAGHTVDYKVINWARAIKMTRKGKYNAIIGAYKEDAPDFVFPDTEFGISKNSFFVLKESSWKYNGLDSLKNIKIGIIKDYSYGDVLDKYFKKSTKFVELVSGDSALNLNIKKMLKKRIDVMIEDINVFNLTAKEMGVLDKIKLAGDSGKGENLYIAFSPKISKSKEYAQILSKGTKKLEESGELVKILEKYGLKYWK